MNPQKPHAADPNFQDGSVPTVFRSLADNAVEAHKVMRERRCDALPIDPASV
jgi:hypothetical protein